MPRLLIVDDNQAFGEGLRGSICGGWSVEVAHSAQEGRQALRANGPWDAVLMDVQLGDGNGLDLMEWARPRHPESWWMVMTSVGDRSVVQRAAELGAAFVPKPFRPRTLQTWLTSVLLRPSHSLEDFVMGAEDAGESAMSAALQRFCSVYELTEGEVRLLECAMAGMGRPQIAKALGISLHTYQKHATSIKKKTGTSVAQAAVRVLRWCVAGPEV